MEWKNAKHIKGNLFEIPERWLNLHFYEALNTLFRVENALRVFVYIILKKKYLSQWLKQSIPNEEGSQGTIESIAKKRMTQAKSFGYLGCDISCPIMHLTSGELIQLITSAAHWPLFKDHFLGAKDIIRNKLDEIGSVRNALAHFRPVRKDDVEVIKQNAKHVLAAVETCLSSVLNISDAVPTNTAEPWYQELSIMGNDSCNLSFTQSNDESWIGLNLEYSCLLVDSAEYFQYSITYKVLTLKSSAILIGHSSLASKVSHLSEIVPYTEKLDGVVPKFRKILKFVFARSTLASDYAEIKSGFETILRQISEQTELIRQDHSARGKLVVAVNVIASASVPEGGTIPLWNLQTAPLWDLVQPHHPPEYWGALGYYASHDFVGGTPQYPWMPEQVARWESPF